MYYFYTIYMITVKFNVNEYSINTIHASSPSCSLAGKVHGCVSLMLGLFGPILM